MNPQDWFETWTVYTRWTNTLTGLIKPFRRVLTNVRSVNRRESTALRTGIVLQQAQTMMVFLQDDIEFVDPTVWRSLPESSLDGVWSLEAGSGTASIVVSGEQNYEFDFGTNVQITQAESAILNANHMLFIPGAIRIAGFESRLRSSPRAQHIMIRM